MLCLSACLSICLCLFACLSVCLSVYLFVCLSICLSICLPVHLSVYTLYISSTICHPSLSPHDFLNKMRSDSIECHCTEECKRQIPEKERLAQAKLRPLLHLPLYVMHDEHVDGRDVETLFPVCAHPVECCCATETALNIEDRLHQFHCCYSVAMPRARSQ